MSLCGPVKDAERSTTWKWEKVGFSLQKKYHLLKMTESGPGNLTRQSVMNVRTNYRLSWKNALTIVQAVRPHGFGGCHSESV